MASYEYQKPFVEQLSRLLETRDGVLDASDTGTGKTYVALEACKNLGLRPLVICPKAVIPSWKRAAEYLDVPLHGVINPEAIKGGKTSWLKSAGKKKWYWSLPTSSVMIFDEVHRFGGTDTQNSLMLASAKLHNLKILMLSATVAENPLRMRAPGFVLGLHTWSNFYSWAREHGCQNNNWGGMEFTKNLEARKVFLRRIHEQIFADRGIRMRISEIPGFPENDLMVESIDLGTAGTKQVSAAYAEALSRAKRLQIHSSRKTAANALVYLLRARQVSELQKVPYLSECVRDLVEEGRSVAVFVCFRESLELLRHNLLCDFDPGLVTWVWGEQDPAEREANIASFQADRARVLISTIQAGGVGISLHDLEGKYARSSLICPDFSMVNLKQAIGRIWRAGAKSKAVQKIVFAAGTVEEHACRSVRRKLENLDLLNDGDLQEGLKWQYVLYPA